MRLSTDRILTTHTGSLPRPAGLSLTGPERDGGQLAGAVQSVVTSQIDAGVDVVNDGEASKVGYSTYVTERLTGFGGEGEPLTSPNGQSRHRCCSCPSPARTNSPAGNLVLRTGQMWSYAT